MSDEQSMKASEWHAMCAAIAKEIEDATEAGFCIEYIALAPIAARYIIDHPKGTHFEDRGFGNVFYAAFSTPVRTTIGKIAPVYEFRPDWHVEQRHATHLIFYSRQPKEVDGGISA